MDFGKRKVRFSLEPLEMREVPAVLGQVVELPAAAAPEAEVARAAPVAVGQNVEAGLRIKLDDILVVGYRTTTPPSIKIDSRVQATVKIDPVLGADKKLDPSQARGTSDAESAGKVQFQDFHFTSTVSKASPKLF